MEFRIDYEERKTDPEQQFWNSEIKAPSYQLATAASIFMIISYFSHVWIRWKKHQRIQNHGRQKHKLKEVASIHGDFGFLSCIDANMHLYIISFSKTHFNGTIWSNIQMDLVVWEDTIPFQLAICCSMHGVDLLKLRVWDIFTSSCYGLVISWFYIYIEWGLLIMCMYITV